MSRALAYFSRSLFAISESYYDLRKTVSIFGLSSKKEVTYFDFDQLVTIPFGDIFEFFEVNLESLELDPKRTQFAVDVGALAYRIRLALLSLM